MTSSLTKCPKWSKSQEAAIRLTLRVWKPVEARLAKGEKLKSPHLEWGDTKRRALSGRCPLCKFNGNSCEECPYKITTGLFCYKDNGHLMAFCHKPTLTNARKVVNLLNKMLRTGRITVKK